MENTRKRKHQQTTKEDNEKIIEQNKRIEQFHLNEQIWRSKQYHQDSWSYRVKSPAKNQSEQLSEMEKMQQTERIRRILYPHGVDLDMNLVLMTLLKLK
jgi:hypothetical protein